eukprot:GHVH01004515.1.p1 GENE.GHVH01004515.1~~GHVH01004515.1.p1  ORF type:complete len:121 (+),score=27.08 GHVH01004515.1:56-418(+)
MSTSVVRTLSTRDVLPSLNPSDEEIDEISFRAITSTLKQAAGVDDVVPVGLEDIELIVKGVKKIFVTLDDIDHGRHLKGDNFSNESDSSRRHQRELFDQVCLWGEFVDEKDQRENTNVIL